ncbi:molybdopterin oxidoreductase family protein [Pseudonocardia benzenivorans]
MLCVDPRRTAVARAAVESGGVHLAPLPGTNLALMNGLLHQVIADDRIDHGYVDAHTVGFDELAAGVAEYPPGRVADICGLDAEEIRAAARLLGSAERLLSTVLQGFYQSHQATAAAVQVNNLNLVRGMLGRPGCGILQMNGQPTAENTRECGADGDMAGFRNWNNDAHVAELARHWNLDPLQIPHMAPPTHAMQMFRYVEQGTIRMLWVSATNPAVSMPDLARIRRILGQERLFLVVQDIFPSETARLADVVLPAATWAEKTGCFTNADRTVHLSDKAVDPPGDARADLDILLDFARRMDFRDADGRPFPAWHDAESAFDAWAASTAGRPCDYTGLSHATLRARASGVQWPCNDAHPDGTERLYADGRFWSAPDECESYGRDLVTGAPLEETEYRALNPDAKAVLKAAEFLPPRTAPDDEYPFALVTGRTIHHFHTRTKTGRTPELRDAAPEPWIECSATDARRCGLGDGDLADVRTAQGAVRARVRITETRDGVLFVPFHYGYWDTPPVTGPATASRDARPTRRCRPTGTPSRSNHCSRSPPRRCRGFPTRAGPRRRRPGARSAMSKIALVLRELGRSQTSLLHELQALPDRHPDEHEIVHTAHDLAGWAAADLQRLGETAADTGVALRSWPRPAPCAAPWPRAPHGRCATVPRRGCCCSPTCVGCTARRPGSRSTGRCSPRPRRRCGGPHSSSSPAPARPTRTRPPPGRDRSS